MSMVLPSILWVVLLFLPGLALLRVAWPSVPPRLLAVFAPTLSFGLIYLTALLASRLTIPAVTATGWLVAVIVVVWVVVDGMRLVSTLRARTSSTGERAFSSIRSSALVQLRRLRAKGLSHATPILLLGFGVVLGVVLWQHFQSVFVFPPGWDAMHHGFFAKQIAEYQTLDPRVVLAPTADLADGGESFYPLGYNVAVALLHNVSGLPISRLMLTGTIVVAGLILPIGAYGLVTIISEKQRMVAGLSAVAGSLCLNLFWILEPGRINAVISLALIPAVAAIFLYKRYDLRFRNIPLAALAFAGLVGVHVSETIVAAVIAGLVVLGECVRRGGARPLIRWLGFAVGAVLLAAIPILLLDGTIIGAAQERSGTLVDDSARLTVQEALGYGLTQGYDAAAQFPGVGISPFFSPYVWPALVALGCALTFSTRYRALRGISLSYMAFLFIWIGMSVGGLGALSILTTPWYGDWVRVSWNFLVLGIVPIGIALDAISRWIVTAVGMLVISLARRARIAGGASKRRTVEVAGAAVAIILVVLVAIPPVGIGAARLAESRGPAGMDSAAAFDWLSHNVEAGTRVFDDVRVDGSLWMYVDYGVQPVFGNSPFVGLEPQTWLDRLWMRENLDKIDSDPCVISTLDRYRVGYLYYGDRFMDDASHHFDIDFLRSNSHFTEVFSEGAAHVFRIDLPADIPACSTKLVPSSRNAF